MSPQVSFGGNIGKQLVKVVSTASVGVGGGALVAGVSSGTLLPTLAAAAAAAAPVALPIIGGVALVAIAKKASMRTPKTNKEIGKNEAKR